MEISLEKWRIVPSHPDLMVSNWGRYMIVPYKEPMEGRGTGAHRGGCPRFGDWNGDVMIAVRKGHRTLKIHRLVCEAFHGPPKPGQVCMHRDDNPRNNRPENLSWGTQKENLNAEGFLNKCRARTGENSAVRMGIRKKLSVVS